MTGLKILILLASIKALEVGPMAVESGRGYRRCGWSTTPDVVRAAARDRARRCVGEDDPKLTVLEKAYWRLERGESMRLDNVGSEIDNGWESWGS